MANDAWTDGILFKILNVVVYILGYIIYPLVPPKDIMNLVGPSEDIFYMDKETYITPAPWAFLIWHLIHLLLLGTVVYQFTPTGKRVVIDRISWRFPLLIVLEVVYNNLRTNAHYIPALNLVFLVSSTVWQIRSILRIQPEAGSGKSGLLVNLPFSLYDGWTTVLFVLANFEAFGVNKYEHHAGAWTKTFVFLAFYYFQLLVVLDAFVTDGDVACAAAISWGLWAIFAHQRSSAFVCWTALAVAILSSFCVVKSAIGLVRRHRNAVRDDDAERAPLMGA